MLLKAQIMRQRQDLDDGEIDRYLKREFGHDLRKLWAVIKGKYPDASLEEFDEVVERLNAFEDVRYPKPDTLFVTQFSFQRSDGFAFDVASDQETRQVRISLDEIDALMSKLWLLFQMPIAPLRGFGEPARKFVEVMYQCGNKNRLYKPTVDMHFRKYE